MILLRWRAGGSNFDVVRVFQRWNSGRQGAGLGGRGPTAGLNWGRPRRRRFSLIQARTQTSWTGARGCARIHVERYPGYTAFACASAFLGWNYAMPKGDLWYQMPVGTTIVSIQLLIIYRRFERKFSYSYFKFYCIVMYINCSEIIRAKMIYIAIFIQINTSYN